jgi:hypothetical protein
MNLKKKLYLDIDGVLLTIKHTRPASCSGAFIEYILSHFDCHWLTTHCKGDVRNVINYLSGYFDKETLAKLSQVKATNWTTLKTEAIDFTNEFYWIEDYPFNSEKEVLIANNCLHRLVLVDLNNKDDLMRVLEFLMHIK